MLHCQPPTATANFSKLGKIFDLNKLTPDMFRQTHFLYIWGIKKISINQKRKV